MRARLRPANDLAYPPALETAEAQLVVQRRGALTRDSASRHAPRTSTEATPKAPASSRARMKDLLKYRRGWNPADSEKLTADPNEPPYMPLPDDTVGFGVSGGGIRSATFALGVFQALAEFGLIRKIDFLSTVSGGGYFGAFLGRLFTRPWVRNADDVERVLRGIDPNLVTE